MALKEIRCNCKMTQKEASIYLNIPLRTYSRYENDSKYENNILYKKMCDDLNKICLIDETHGILQLSEIKRIVGKVFSKYDIKFCYLFGSYSKSMAHESSDIDLIIDTKITGLDFYGLLQELIDSLHKKVDLIRLTDALENPELISEIMKYGIRIYG